MNGNLDARSRGLGTDALWAPAGRRPGVQHDLPPPPTAGRPPQSARGPQTAEFGRAHRPAATTVGLDVDGPRLQLWGAPTDNDRGGAWNTRRALVGEPMARRGWTGGGGGRDLVRETQVSRQPPSAARGHAVVDVSTGAGRRRVTLSV